MKDILKLIDKKNKDNSSYDIELILPRVVDYKFLHSIPDYTNYRQYIKEIEHFMKNEKDKRYKKLIIEMLHSKNDEIFEEKNKSVDNIKKMQNDIKCYLEYNNFLNQFN